MGLSFTIAVGPRQHIYSQVGIPRESWPYFTVWNSSFPQPRRPGPSIYIPQEQRGPVTTPGTGFTFRRLLRLAAQKTASLLLRAFTYVKMCLLSHCLETGCITPLFYCCVRVLLSNGCFSGSIVLAWSKYTTVHTLDDKVPDQTTVTHHR
jgi:hypothetical protein